MKKRSVIVVGGGASGLTAAIFAARAGANVTVIEHMDRVGKKILSTGNGRCNLTNRVMNGDCYRCGRKDFPMEVIGRFDVGQTLDFFKGLGILPKDRQGYIYPNSDQASSVLDVLRLEAEHLNITFMLNCEAERIKKLRDGEFQVKTPQGPVKGGAVILAAGSKAAPVTGSDGSGYRLAEELGHRVVKPLPALVQLCCKGRFFKLLSGVRSDVRLSLFIDGKQAAADSGELQLTDYGISGIPTFQVSRYASIALDKKRKVEAVIDFLPSLTETELKRELERRSRDMGYRSCGDLMTGMLNKKLASVLLKEAGIEPSSPASGLSGRSRQALLEGIKQFTVEVTAARPFENAQVCCGGVDVNEVDSTTMESRIVKGLYLCGEILDVDGICGGYNLQFAWSSGAIAGTSAGGMENIR